jgi:endonuclease/exonuclease/phosphatase family metal-dependent hydrolase
MPTSLREIARHIDPYPPTPTTLRKILKQPTANLRLHLQVAPFSVMCQNMGLMVAPAPYLGTDREGAIDEIVSQIQRLSPDVVGLCEVFADGEREDIFNRLKHIYPHFQEGPDKTGLLDRKSDGGLLLLSKHPISQAHAIIYEDCASWDCLAYKGMIHIRVKSPHCPMAHDIFFTHAQDIEPDGGREALYKQLMDMNNMIHQYADPNSPTLIMGDINIPGESPTDYTELLNRLRRPVDFWVVNGNEENSGFTFVADNNFYEDEDDNPRLNRRVDYVLMKAGARFIPILKNIEILKFTHQGRFISDHFGLYAQMQTLVNVDIIN